MKRVLALAFMFSLILGFQNCSQSSLQPEGVLSGDVAVTLPQSGVSPTSDAAVAAKVTYVEIPNVTDSNLAPQKLSDVVSPHRLVISLQTGVIQLMDEANAPLEQRCLSASSLDELKTILSGASICAAQVTSADICAMSYKPAYASLYANESRVLLGEERDSCGTGRKDLCGALAEVFQAYVSHVKANWSEMNCQ